MHVNYKLIKLILLALRDRPAAIPIHVKAIDDTSNFDEFPESDLDSSKLVFFFIAGFFNYSFEILCSF